MDNISETDDDASYELCVNQTQSGARVDEVALMDAVRAVLAAERVSQADLSFALVDDETIARLHEEHMGLPGATDVLTFDLRDGAEEGGKVEGEVVISADTAAREAARRQHRLEHEVLLYAVHGTLHLLGYDDCTVPQARAMHARENELLTELGVGPVYGDLPE